MILTDAQVLDAFFNESFDLVFSTDEQALRLSQSNDLPDLYSRWLDYQEEMKILAEEAQAEMEIKW
jgi:hypothetical protein